MKYLVLIVILFNLILLPNSCAQTTEEKTNQFFITDQNDIRLSVVEDKLANTLNTKRSVAIYRQNYLIDQSSLYLNLFRDNRISTDKNGYQWIGAKFTPMVWLDKNPQMLFQLAHRFTGILKYQYPQRFIMHQYGCMNQQDHFFQCLYEEKENWNIRFFVNDGEISLNIYPVLDKETHQLIGGEFVIIYRSGTGRYLDALN